jgi:hypothetical protein
MAALSETRSSSIPLAGALARPAILLGAMVAVSTVTRTVVAWQHSVPRYLPDEYVYASLGRSIAHGNLRVNGVTALFPAIIAPLLAAPLWAAFPLETAYHLIQAENALFASLTAVPVYLLARRVGLGSGLSLLCGAYALVTPTLVMLAFNLTDFAAYPLVLTAILFAQRALERPTRRDQLLFLCFTGAATLTRTEYVILVPAYAVAAFAIERRRAVRLHWIALAAVVPGVVALVVALTGYFSGARIPIESADFSQVGLQAFLLTLVAGVVIVPGAVVGLWRPPDRRTLAFAWIATTFAVLLIIEIGLFSVTTPSKFRERYLFAIVPLFAIAFGVYLKRGMPYRWGVFILSAVLAVAAARIPVSAYSTGAANYDGQTLIAIEWLQRKAGAASASFVVAGLLTLGGIWATLGALWKRSLLALPAAMALAIAFTVVATRDDLRATRLVRTGLPPDLQWVDRTARHPFAAIGTPLSSARQLLELLYWNPDVSRYLVLDDANIPVSYAGPAIGPGLSGRLHDARGYFLFDANGTQATFTNARFVKAQNHYQLWHSTETPQLRTLVEGMWPNGWLIAGGRIRAWPETKASGKSVRLSFDVGVPKKWPGYSILKLNGKRWNLVPGKPMHVVCESRGIVNVLYSSPSTVFDEHNNVVSVRLTNLRAVDVPPSAASGRRASCRSA